MTAIRAGDTDGNDATIADPNWISLLNTPAIPDDVSTHSVLGEASAEVLRRCLKTMMSLYNTSGVPFCWLNSVVFELLPGSHRERSR